MIKLSKEIEKILENRKEKKIVFTNGCFDILHKGHVAYLNQAKAQGDILILGLNSDCSVSRLKGPDRPVNSQEDRKFIMENLRSIDCVEIFKEDTPYDLIKSIMPDVLVKGGDWPIESIVGHDVVLASGGEVKSLNFEEGYSTTGLINQVQGKS